MQSQLPALPPHHQAWSCTEAWDTDDVRLLQCYYIYIRMQGHDGRECGPDWAMQKRRAQVHARLGAQRAAGDSKHGLDHLLAPGLGKAEHIRQALLQQNPFGNDMPLDTDLHFAAEAMIRWGVFIDKWRGQQRQAHHRLLQAMQPLRMALDQLRTATSAAVAGSRDIAGLALMTALLRWPDQTQAMGYLHGFEVVGSIATSRVFRPIAVTDLEDDFFGAAAAAEVQHAITAPPPKHAESIYALTQEEIAKGFTEPLCSAAVLDSRYGKGQWRPIYRFLLHQGDKERLIDDGRRGGQNPCRGQFSQSVWT